MKQRYAWRQRERVRNFQTYSGDNRPTLLCPPHFPLAPSLSAKLPGSDGGTPAWFNKWAPCLRGLHRKVQILSGLLMAKGGVGEVGILHSPSGARPRRAPWVLGTRLAHGRSSIFHWRPRYTCRQHQTVPRHSRWWQGYRTVAVLKAENPGDIMVQQKLQQTHATPPRLRRKHWCSLCVILKSNVPVRFL